MLLCVGLDDVGAVVIRLDNRPDRVALVADDDGRVLVHGNTVAGQSLQFPVNRGQVVGCVPRGVGRLPHGVLDGLARLFHRAFELDIHLAFVQTGARQGFTHAAQFAVQAVQPKLEVLQITRR